MKGDKEKEKIVYDRGLAGSVPARKNSEEHTESPGSRRHSAESTSSVTVTVVNSLLAGAAAVGSYMWSFWAPPEAPQNEASSKSSNVKEPKPHAPPPATRPDASPTVRLNVSYLESTDYGIKLVGRTATGEDALLTQDMINRVPPAHLTLLTLL
jgi:hypothetical protein